MIHDDQIPTLLDFAGQIIDDPGVAAYVDGVAYHWYNMLEGTYEDGPTEVPGRIVGADNLVNGGLYVRQIYDKLKLKAGPAKFVLATEACNGYALGTKWVGPRPGEWGYGYAYSHDILWQLRNGATGWTDWNLMLNLKGGPNLAGNFVDSPIVANGSEAFFKNPSFFHIAHFSKYITKGSKQVRLNITCGARHPEWCQAASFLTPEGKAVVVLTNDEVTVGPVAGAAGGLGKLGLPRLAQGQGSITLGDRSLTWSISCRGHTVRGRIPWKAIQTVILPCANS